MQMLLVLIRGTIVWTWVLARIERLRCSHRMGILTVNSCWAASGSVVKAPMNHWFTGHVGPEGG